MISNSDVHIRIIFQVHVKITETITTNHIIENKNMIHRIVKITAKSYMIHTILCLTYKKLL